MNSRISMVKNINVRLVSFSGVFEIGDAYQLTPRSYIFAVQREVSTYFKDEAQLEDYTIFTNPIPQIPITENVNMSIKNMNPYIKVDNVNLGAVSAAAVFQVGSNYRIDTESRVKHIRHLIRDSNEEQEEEIVER